MFEMLDGKGTELGIINAIGWGIFLLAKAGAFRKMKVWIKIGGNGKPNNPGNPTSLIKLKTNHDNLKDSFEKMEERNREDHKNIFDKIEDIWKAIRT